MNNLSLSLKRVPPFKHSAETGCAKCGKQISPDEYSYRIDRSGDAQMSDSNELICVTCGEKILY